MVSGHQDFFRRKLRVDQIVFVQKLDYRTNLPTVFNDLIRCKFAATSQNRRQRLALNQFRCQEDIFFFKSSSVYLDEVRVPELL